MSDSYEIDATSKITHRDGVISGSWSEATRKISGKVTGEARNDSIAATVEGPGLTISLSIITRNQTQAASIKLQDASVAVTLTQE